MITTDKIFETILGAKMTPHQRICSLQLCEYLLINYNKNWNSISAKFFLTSFGARYISFLSKLKQLGIVETRLNKEGKETYVNVIEGKESCSKQYRLNYKFMGEIVNKYSFSYRGYPVLCIPMFCVFALDLNSDSYKTDLLYYTKRNLNDLTIDFKELEAIKNKKISEIDSKIVVNEKIKKEGIIVVRYFSYQNGIAVLSDNYNYRINKENFLSDKKGKVLIEYDNEYIIANSPEEYVAYKKNEVNFSYDITINMLKEKQFYANRNETNNRLDSNITSLSSALTDAICVQNDLVQLDLGNSQFAILAHQMKYEEVITDSNEFAIQSSNGNLYEYMMSSMGKEDRNEVKKMMFELFFSKNSSFIATKEEIKRIFPQVHDYVYNYKELNRYEDFAIMLQKFESNLFIDCVLTRLMKEGIWALSKHDSIICKKADVAIVNKIVEDEFKKINFKGTIKQK